MDKSEFVHTIKNFLMNNKKQALLITGSIMFLIFLLFSDAQKDDNIEDSVFLNSFHAEEIQLEERLETFLEKVEGVGKAKVCVTYDYLERAAYAQNSDSDSATDRQDISNDYIIIENADGSENGLLLSVKAPVVRGVSVACEGAGSAKVKNEVTQLLVAVLDISSNRVYVSEYTDNN